jgi:hypothetical protein
VSSTRVSGLTRRRPSLRFTVHAAKHSKLRRVTVELPKGLSFRTHTIHKRRHVLGLAVKGAKLKSARMSKGHLVLTLRRPVASATVTISSKGLRESAALHRAAVHKKLKRLRLTLVVRTSAGKSRTLHVSIKHLGL